MRTLVDLTSSGGLYDPGQTTNYLEPNGLNLHYQDTLVVGPPRGRVRQKCHSIHVVGGFGTPLRYASWTDGLENVMSALLERVFFHEVKVPGQDGDLTRFERPRLVSEADVDARLNAFSRRLKWRAFTLTPVGLLEYPQTVYRGQKLVLYNNAAQRVLARGPRRSDAYLSTFLKHEKIPVTAKRAVPRVIQPRSPEYNVQVGRYLHQLEHIIYQTIADIFGGPTVMKGKNAFQVGREFHSAWVTYRDPVAVGLDASRFDQHVNTALLKWEHRVYLQYYPGSAELAELLSWQLDNVGYVRCHDGTVKYTVRGGRCSGDMNTALGNCLLMCAMVWTLLHEKGLHKKVRLFNNGDDCVLIGERGDLLPILDSVIPYFAEFGIVMKVEEPVDVLEKVSFCQTQPVYDGVYWRMVRDPHASMSKDVCIIDPRNAMPKTLSDHCSSVGQCGLSLTGGLPILQEYYLALRRGGRVDAPVDEEVRGSGFYQLSKGLLPTVREVTPEARCSFYRAFGIVPDVQCAMEAYFAGLPPVAWSTPGLGAVPRIALI